MPLARALLIAVVPLGGCAAAPTARRAGAAGGLAVGASGRATAAWGARGVRVRWPRGALATAGGSAV